MAFTYRVLGRDRRCALVESFFGFSLLGPASGSFLFSFLASGLLSVWWWSMSGRWADSDRHSRLPTDWADRRRAVLERDGGACQELTAGGVRCGRRASEVDHVVPGDDHSFSNLRALCSYCHGQKSAREGSAAYWAGVRRSRGKFRVGRGDVHPGLIGGGG